MVTAWAAEDSSSARGASLSPRTTLIAWLTLALEGKPLSLLNAADLLRERLGKDATIIGAGDLPAALSLEKLYAMVLSATRRVVDTVDYAPLPAGRLTKSEFEELQKARAANEGALEAKRVRFTKFAGALLQAQYDSLPDSVRTHNVNLAIDSHFLPVGARGIGRAQYERLNGDERVSSEPDAGFYVRGGQTARVAGYGWEYEVATLLPHDAARPGAVPNIALGIAAHRPGVAFANRACDVFDDILNRGVTLDQVVADRAYCGRGTGQTLLQRHLRRHGAKLVRDYKKHEKGQVLAATDRAILVEGGWYTPNLPDVLRNANVDFENAWQQARSSNASVVARTETHRRLEDRRDALLAARRRYEVPESAFGAVTDEDTAASYVQHYAYGSTPWREMFRIGRNAIESYGVSLRGIDASLRGGSSKLRGEAAHAFMTTMIVAATNARRITEWAQKRELSGARGLLVDEFYPLYSAVSSRLTDAMATWSRRMQADAVSKAEANPQLDHAGGHWTVRLDEAALDWVPGDSASTIRMQRADDETATALAGPLIDSVERQATELLARLELRGVAPGDCPDLSQDVEILLRLELIHAQIIDDEEEWVAVPEDGVLVGAEAILVPRDTRPELLGVGSTR